MDIDNQRNLLYNRHRCPACRGPFCLGAFGIRLVTQTNEPLVPWAWGVNGCAAVIGSILSVMLAQSLGFTAVLGIAVVVYMVGLGAILTLKTTR